MRRSFLLSTAAIASTLTLALGCADQPTPTGVAGDPTLAPPQFERQAVDRFTRRGPWEEDITNPCTGAVIHFVGEIKEQSTAVGPQELLDQGFNIHFEDQTLLTGTGTDPVSGATYFIRRQVHFSFNSPTIEAVNLTQSFRTTVQAVTRGPGDNFLLHLRFHLTVLPSGEVATVFEVESAECRG
jgi:hypothetical protein